MDICSVFFLFIYFFGRFILQLRNIQLNFKGLCRNNLLVLLDRCIISLFAWSEKMMQRQLDAVRCTYQVFKSVWMKNTTK